MKKLIALMFFVSLFSVGISNAQTNGNQTSTTKRGQFVDKNKDGVCDNNQYLQTNPKGSKFVDKNNDGICDNYQNSKTNANCPNFVDKNKDDICDNAQNEKQSMCCGRGMQCGKGNGLGLRKR